MSALVLKLIKPFGQLKKIIYLQEKTINFLGKKQCVIILFLVFLGLFFFYLFLVYYLVQSKYVIENYQLKLTKLEEEKKDLETELQEINFWKEVREEIERLNFQKINSIKYIHVLEKSVITLKK